MQESNEFVSEGIVCGFESCSSNSSDSWTNCGCSWDSYNGVCLSSYEEKSCDLSGEVPGSFGSCYYRENTQDNCDDGFLSYSWIGEWTWHSENIFDSNPDSDDEGYILGTDGNYHYDPEGKSESCIIGGDSIVPCPAQIQLSFFNFYNLIIAIIIIAGIYFFLKKSKKKGKRKKR